MDNLTGNSTQDENSEKLFDEGFDIEKDTSEQASGEQEAIKDAEQANIPPNIPQADTNPNAEIANSEQVQDFTTPYTAPVYQDPPPQVVIPPAETKEIKSLAIPDIIASEYAELKELNPDAAQIATEDSPEGKLLRERLETHGAESAGDKAELFLYKRLEEQKNIQAQQSSSSAQIDAHNRNFKNVLQKEVPEYAALFSDSNRHGEAVKYKQDILDWVSQKPYSEAAGMMEIVQYGKNPNQVASLIKKFESERKPVTNLPDPADYTGALAVPGRGAPVAPSGVGDKDDFEAGWTLNK